MEIEVENTIVNTTLAVCSTCLSIDRNLFALNGLADAQETFRLLMYDFTADGLNTLEMDHLVCWECLAMLRRFTRFRNQAHLAQEQLRMMGLDRQNPIQLDHSYVPQTLSTLAPTIKVDYDKIYFDYAAEWPQLISISSVETEDGVKNEMYDVAQAVRDNINIDIGEHLIEIPEIVLENSATGVMSHIVVSTDALVKNAAGYALKPDVNIHPLTNEKIETGMINATEIKKEKEPMKAGYITEYMSESEMQNSREIAKTRVQYSSAVYKCELCVIGFHSQLQVEEHFVSAHKAEPGLEPCKVCYVYITPAKLQNHVDSHYLRYICKLCQHIEYSSKLIALHIQSHRITKESKDAVKVVGCTTVQGRKKKSKAKAGAPPKPGDLRKLLSKTTIEGYQCLECDMFFKNSRARKNHVARFHREGLQCDVCKKRFVNKTTLATHLRLHEGPLPREECPICLKMVRVIQLKYHIQRHQNKSHHECRECGKVFSHLATYQAHLKYSRAHASDNVFKFPCPMCNKGYPTKEQMQDHFNYQHLGRTAHKCPICEKPIASRANVEKHMMRVHREKMPKPRNHRCQQCGKTFTDRKSLIQHEVIHSGERPLSCEVCSQTFKQKASLYTHRKRVHKIFPAKRVVEFMDTKLQQDTS